MKILITGSSGQLGSELRELFGESSGHELYFMDSKQLPLEQTMIIQGILGIYQPELIIHAAAYTAVDKAESEGLVADQVNHLASEEIAQYCRLHDVKLIAISTDYVFDGSSASPLTEDAAAAPINVYGETKLAGEQAIQKWAPQYIIIRTSWVYSTYGSNFVKTMMRLMTEREEISVIADQIGSPTYARDLAEAIIHIIETGNWKNGIFNFSNEGEISWYDLAVAIRDIKGLQCKINAIPTEQYPTPAKRPKYSLLDKTKIKDSFGVEVPQWKDSLVAMLGRM
ncbi:dTDP-4-dehydrorhamnose reductase [Sphingobacterium griseoflavum]|uniref:dTDP-4-dehydrorhamnose reductase n=1 Tax=Sphingobacterium griseoflavum TaxID=1474952 RepID=A0ABQ3HVJ7_9SPHI|nr:dTDP-4-dehydrorhamnose reductase [Sphingobacterium griseoflavum]GHE38864.1 NAD(P)-dependent oxidoreductase [Sphingobacterium griseoflavum]